MGGGVSTMQRWDRHYDVWLACELGNLPVVRRAVDMGSIGVHDTNPITGDTLLQIAAREGYIELVQLLLGAVSVGKGDQGAMKGKDELKWADVDASNRAHQTPLMLALSPSFSRKANRTIAEFEDKMSLRPVEGELGQLRLASCLVDAGADVSKADHRGTTALSLTAQQGWAIATDYLLRRGASSNTVDRNGQTPLMLAAANGNPMCVQRLLQAAARPDEVDPEGNSALMIAAQAGHSRCVTILLQYQADVNIRNKQRLTAYHIACRRGDGPSVRQLVLAGAERNITIEQAVPEDRRDYLRVAMETTLWGRGVYNPVADERAATIPMLPKHLRSLPTFSFMSEVDAALLIRECCFAPEFTIGEVILSQGEISDTMYWLVEGELLFTHTSPPKLTQAEEEAAEDAAALREAGPEPMVVPRLAAGFEVIHSPVARHKKFGPGIEATVSPHANRKTVSFLMRDTDRHKYFGEPFLTCSRRSDVTVTAHSRKPVQLLAIDRKHLVEYLNSTEFFSMLHSPPKVFKLRDRLARCAARGHEVFKIPQWLINRGIRDIMVFNVKRGRFRLGGAKKKQYDHKDPAGSVLEEPSVPSLHSQGLGFTITDHGE